MLLHNCDGKKCSRPHFLMTLSVENKPCERKCSICWRWFFLLLVAQTSSVFLQIADSFVCTIRKRTSTQLGARRVVDSNRTTGRFFDDLLWNTLLLLRNFHRRRHQFLDSLILVAVRNFFPGFLWQQKVIVELFLMFRTFCQAAISCGSQVHKKSKNSFNVKGRLQN